MESVILEFDYYIYLYIWSFVLLYPNIFGVCLKDKGVIVKRFLYKDIREHLSAKQISLIIGARQVGKTTLLKQLESELNEGNKIVHYFSLEDKEILDLLDKNAKNLLQLIYKPNKTERVYVLIDEIQYLKDPSNFLKYHYDTYLDQIKFIVTGSSSFYIDKKFKDSLAGRKRIFELPTLSLKEVLHFKGEDKLVSFLNSNTAPLLYTNKIKEYFYEYLIYGGYPEVVLNDSKNEKKLILKEIRDSYAKKDAVESKLLHHNLYLHLMKLLAGRTGNLLNINSLTADIQLDNKTIDHYLWVMRKSFHIHYLVPFYKNISSELRKMPKIFFADLGMRNSLINNFSSIGLREDRGAVLENYIFILFKNKYNLENIRYWRVQTKNEIDFIIKTDSNEQFAYEVKFNRKGFSMAKYKNFTNNYPDIPLNCIDLDSAISFQI